MDGTIFSEDFRAVVFERLEPRLLLSVSAEPAGFVSVQWAGQSAQARPGEWVVRFQDGLDGSDQAALLNADLIESGIASGVLTGVRRSQFGLLTAPGLSSGQVQAWAESQSSVLYVEPNLVYSVDTASSTLPDDSLFTDGSLWGLHNTGQSGGTADADIDAPEAWDLTTGLSDVVVAVVDSGIDYTHPDLAGNIWVNPGEVPGNGLDDDNNGYIDDVHGWDFVNGDNDPMDDEGHGTHVAGTVGGVGDNSIGVSGVNWSVGLMALKHLDAFGFGDTYDTILSVEYATMMRRDYGVNVVATNHSWGEDVFTTGLLDAIEESGQEGVLCIAAASNEGDDNDIVNMYPANYDSQYIISVAATDRDDELADFSNYGPASVDLGAPGVSIYSTVLGGGYDWYDGTSMAAPHVAGVAALLGAYKPQATAVEIKDAILAGADPVASLDGMTITGGRLNAFGALLALGALEPRVMSITPSNQSPPVDAISIDFSESMEPASVVGANFLLRDNGADNVFDTADDIAYPIGDSDLSQPQGDRVVVSLSGDLPAEEYRMIISGSGANPVRDLDGNSLNEGNGHTHFFTIKAMSPATEPNDTIASAVPSGIVGAGDVLFFGEIGDNQHGDNDVDLFRIQVSGPGTLRAETDTSAAGGVLDTFLRLFNAVGGELAYNDDSDRTDSLIEYEIDAGAYYIGVSSYGNESYDPSVESGSGGSTNGEYDLELAFLGPPEIHGVKWNDLNLDGVRDEGEGPLSGWTIFLDNDVDGVLDPGEMSTVTDAEGNFSFTGLEPGAYAVAQVDQAGWMQTYPSHQDAGLYAAYSTGLAFEDISGSGQGVLAGEDDAYHHLSAADLGGFEFPMYGVSYGEIYIDTNGLLTFEQPPAETWANDDMSDSIPGAAIAVLWDDLLINGSADSAIYWELRGSGDDERLIIQWQNVDYMEAETVGAITFQAILGADGGISMNYSELDTGDVGTGGQLATVGVKDAGSSGHRILLSHDSGPNQYVGTGRSTHLVHPLPGQHAVSVQEGDVETGVLFGGRRDGPPGDITGDGAVDDEDVMAFKAEFGARGPGLVSDLDGDGYVGIGDFAVLRAHYGTSAPVSAPATGPSAVWRSADGEPVGALEETAPTDADESTPGLADSVDVLARAAAMNVAVGPIACVGEPVSTHISGPRQHMMDRGVMKSDLSVRAGQFDPDELLDGVLVSLLDRTLI